MKIALLSDIHSNVFALEAVLANVEQHRVDIAVNLGDILYGPIAPQKTFELLMRHDLITLKGNQDRQIYESTNQEVKANPTLQFILDDLGDEPIAWLKSLPFDKRLNNEVYCCHGSPKSDLTYLLENIETGSATVNSDKKIIKHLNEEKSDVICCGHTHTPRTVDTSSGQLIVNPGSVGLPAYTDDEPIKHSIENYSHHASYAILEKGEFGWIVQHIKVPYDIESAIKECKKRNREDWVTFLTTGRRK
jgi:predicted phosphodiesterase